MARNFEPSQQAFANLSVERMRDAIPRLERRIAELESIQVSAFVSGNEDAYLDAQVQRVNTTLSDIFGQNTIEYQRNSIESLSAFEAHGFGQHGSFILRAPFVDKEIKKNVIGLKAIVAILKERLDDNGSSGLDRALRAYNGLELHPEIARHASKLYTDGHFANAVEAAVKALNVLVRLRSRLEQDGVPLMEQAFSPKNPVLKFNAFSDQSDRDEQKGFMQMFCGAVSGLRNPRAHGFIKDDPERALEFIAFVSLLAKLLDEAQL